MKPSILYQSNPISTSSNIECLEGFMTTGNYIDFEKVDVKKNDKIVIKNYVNHVYDHGERYFSLFSVWFEENPVMICQWAGDYNEFITNKDSFENMINYLKSLIVEEEKEDEELKVYNENDDITDIDHYGFFVLDEHYIPETVKPMYKQDDIVIATVKENHVRDEYAFQKTVFIETRCKVLAVNPHHPTETYQFLQMDRRWETQNEIELRGGSGFGEIINDRGNGTIYAYGNDDTILRMAE